MTRQKKYPDTKTFHFHNENPKGRYTTDCAIRAIATATQTPYNDVVGLICQVILETGYTLEPKGLDEVFRRLGWRKCRQPRMSAGFKYTGEQFCRGLQAWLRHGDDIEGAEKLSDRIVANIGGHHMVAIIDGKVWDTWNSTDGCIGNYWVKA